MITGVTTADVAPSEPLELSAPLARRAATTMCRSDPLNGETCAWYHGIWQYLRLMDLAGTPSHHADFYKRALLGTPLSCDTPKVLVSAGADYCMFAQVVAAFRSRGIEPAVTVVDVCDTALYLNRWYAERIRCRLEAVRADILDFAPAIPFDALCAHAFLGFFSASRRPSLVAAWRKLLRPGGKVITVNRVRPGADGASRTGFSPEQVRVFRDSALRKAESLSNRIAIDPVEIAREAEVYATKHGAWPVQSGEEIRNLFERSGFNIEELSGDLAAASSSAAIGGLAIPGAAGYVNIIASRR